MPDERGQVKPEESDTSTRQAALTKMSVHGKWSRPVEVPHGYMMFVDGQFDDWLIGLDSLDADLLDWSQNRLGYAENLLTLGG